MEKDSERDITKFCYHDSNAYSKGAEMFSPNKKDLLICTTDPHGIAVVDFDNKGKSEPPLRWVREADLKRPKR